MEKINASKDVGEHTVFGGSDVPPMGVTTEHQADLEKVIRYTLGCNILCTIAYLWSKTALYTEGMGGAGGMPKYL